MLIFNSFANLQLDHHFFFQQNINLHHSVRSSLAKLLLHTFCKFGRCPTTGACDEQLYLNSAQLPNTEERNCSQGFTLITISLFQLIFRFLSACVCLLVCCSEAGFLVFHDRFLEFAIVFCLLLVVLSGYARLPFVVLAQILYITLLK